jgi:hypothetical protein
MILDCLACVIRTGGIKTAPAAEQGADGNLIETQQRDQYRFHSIRERGSRRAAKRVKRMRHGIGARARTSNNSSQSCAGSGADDDDTGGGAGGAAWRRAISRATLPSSISISVRHSALRGGETALGSAFLSTRVDRRNSTSQPSNSARRTRKLSRAIRFTRLRVAARGANFLPTTSPRRAAWPVGRA